MAIPKRHISTRTEVSASMQCVEALVVGTEGPLVSAWESALRAGLESESGDLVETATSIEDAVRMARNRMAPLIFFDLRLVHLWEPRATEEFFDSVGPVSVVIAISDVPNEAAYEALSSRYVLDDYRVMADRNRIKPIISSARERLYLRARLGVEHSEGRSHERLQKLNKIGIALSKERDLDKLLALILRECRGLLDADAGSIWILESERSRRPQRKILGRSQRKSSATAIRYGTSAEALQGYMLRFAVAQNDSMDIPFSEVSLPVNLSSIVGYTALKARLVNIPNLYEISEAAPYKFSRAMDEKYGYRSVSMLSVPMLNMKDELVGVIQLINKKKDPLQCLIDPETTASHVLPFEEDEMDLAVSLGNQAGTALENVRLYDSINNLFESFVTAAVRAIEQRDPSTAGHSARVDRVTLGLADIIRKKTDGVFANVTFSDEEMVELHYAGILHDVGKIGVREHILTKANKLFPGQEVVVHVRADLLKMGVRAAASDLHIDLAQKGELTDARALEIQTERDLAIAQIDKDVAHVFTVNKPGFMNDDQKKILDEIYERQHRVPPGIPDRLLVDEEYRTLCTRKGSLTEEERKEIESHVSKSRAFLEQIPWSFEFQNVAQIAGQHHEKMNGKGYPDAIPAKETPLQSRIMAVADVFDSLTAGDRPYKPAIPLERAIEILQSMAKFGDLDPDVVKLFIDDKVWEKLNLKVLRLADANEAQRNAQ